MPHDVTMPQLGMAQDAGKIVSWLKSPGEAVSKGDALFEVETDKATMEVEAQADGFLTGVSAGEGEDVPVGAVIARISDSAEDDASAPPPAQAEDGTDDAADELPEGHAVTMPQLGMAQDSGVLVSWQKSPGDAVSADDVLFEVETDKSTMEVEAGREGFLAATLAEAGEEVPVGEAVAIISAEAPDMPLSRSRGSATAVAEPTARAPEAKKPRKSRKRNRAWRRNQRRALRAESSPRPRRADWRWNRDWTSPASWTRATTSRSMPAISRRSRACPMPHPRPGSRRHPGA
jgi:pyruvate/2-oxoglutarate dehydrogenase complex dihydrolipoamide acyltransferase (E2) component